MTVQLENTFKASAIKNAILVFAFQAPHHLNKRIAFSFFLFFFSLGSRTWALNMHHRVTLMTCHPSYAHDMLNSSSRIVLWAPRTIQEFSSKTFRGYRHAKDKWIGHLEQTELCYTEKYPTDDKENITIQL